LGLASEAFEPHDRVPVALPDAAVVEFDAVEAVEPAAVVALDGAVVDAAVEPVLLEEPHAARKAAPATPASPPSIWRRFKIEKPTSDGLGDRSVWNPPWMRLRSARGSVNRMRTQSDISEQKTTQPSAGVKRQKLR
jgi:hypothetical protein